MIKYKYNQEIIGECYPKGSGIYLSVTKEQTAMQYVAEMMEHPNNFNPFIEKGLELEKEQKIQAQLDVLYNALNSNDVKQAVKQTIKELKSKQL